MFCRSYSLWWRQAAIGACHVLGVSWALAGSGCSDEQGGQGAGTAGASEVAVPASGVQNNGVASGTGPVPANDAVTPSAMTGAAPGNGSSAGSSVDPSAVGVAGPQPTETTATTMMERAGAQSGQEEQVEPESQGVEPAANPASVPAAATDPRVPPEVGRSLQEWPLPGRDYNNSRYSQDTPISSASVDDLAVAWRVDLPRSFSPFGALSTVPIISDGTVYLEDLTCSVWAIDVETGEVRWTVASAGLDDLNPGPNGVAVGWGKVFALRGSDTVVAYDAETGAELWSKNVVDTATAGIDIQPTLFDGSVLVSTVPISTRGIYTGGDRGIIKALDQESGEERWRFDTIASPTDVWGNDELNSGGGSWYPPSIDLESGNIFWAVANPAPFPGTADFPNGTSRPGENLYTESTVVLDAREGRYQWHHQTIPGDLFDRDLLHTMLTEVDGVPVVVSTGKEGRVWALRRDTGEVLWGPVPIGVHMNDDLPELSARGSTQVFPGSFGGVLTPPALAEGVVYAATLNAPTSYYADRTAYFGSEIGSMDGSLAAIDVRTGEILWEVPVEGDPTGGVTVLNDLVLTANFQGNVMAFERSTGEEVWRWDAPGGINGWMSVAGDKLIIPVGMANPPTLIALSTGAEPMVQEPSTSTGQGTPSAGGDSFSGIYEDILLPKCAGAPCHSGGNGGTLFIDPGKSASELRATLVNAAASGVGCESSGLSVVVPGDADASLLFSKLSEPPPCGTRMPPAPLSSEAQGRIRRWIEAGAQDN